MSGDLSQYEITAHQALARELPLIREALVKHNEWMETLVYYVEAFSRMEEPETIFTDVELPLTDEDLQALVEQFEALSPGDQHKVFALLKQMEAALDGQ